MPTRDNLQKYPYQNIVFFASSTILDTSAESREDNRGFFTKSIEKCFRESPYLNDTRECIRKKYSFTAVILPKDTRYDKIVFHEFLEGTF